MRTSTDHETWSSFCRRVDAARPSRRPSHTYGLRYISPRRIRLNAVVLVRSRRLPDRKPRVACRHSSAFAAHTTTSFRPLRYSASSAIHGSVCISPAAAPRAPAGAACAVEPSSATATDATRAATFRDGLRERSHAGSSLGGLVEHPARFRYWLSVGVRQRPTVTDESMPAAVMNEPPRLRAATLNRGDTRPAALDRIVRVINWFEYP